jgi:hypothetical protein
MSPRTMPCPKNGRKLQVIVIDPGILSAFCHYCSAWHNWERKDLERKDEQKIR